MARCASCGRENPEGFRFCGACGTELVAAPAPREVRKTVTVVFCDVTGSTAMGERLDPESTRRVMARYFDAMRAAIERHGGTVEKFIGDAVMAVFGIPVVHEDDALRAARAAVDMRSALAAVNEELERDWGVRLAIRIGMNTGEVVTGEGDSLATGDAVNVAARLEQAAAPDEILIGESTFRLVREAVDAEPAAAVNAKGKSEPVAAYRLTEVKEGAESIPRRLDAPMVGRGNELAQLQRAYDHAVSERVPYLFTVLGSAGIGKSRLLREFLDGVDGGATVLTGRCLPYGEGITYWPLVEMFGGDPDAIELGADRNEIALATRRRLEAMAREHPLLVLLDDLQWAEPTFLDLVDHVTDLARDSPMLIACLARPDLLDTRPSWGGGKLNSATIMLEALTEDESAALVDNLIAVGVPTDLKRRIATAAEGNPLFVEEMLSMLTEDLGAIAVPPTIQALLAARLDRLTRDERIVLESGAVQGQEFDRSSLEAMLPPEVEVTLSTHLQSLVRKDLIRPVQGDDDQYRFKHLLLRDAAYDALPKEARAELHEAFVDWVEARRPDFDAIIGYHLEQAYYARADLGPVDERAAEIARRATGFLTQAGFRARDRADIHATINLLERAIRLLPENDESALELYPDLGSALIERGEFQRSAALFETAERLGAHSTALRARMRRIWLELLRGGPQSDAIAPLEAVLAEAEHNGDEQLAAEALWRLGVLSMWVGDNERSAQLLRRGFERAESVGDLHVKTQVVHWIALILLWGPAPVDYALSEVRRFAAASDLDKGARTELMVIEGALLALTGEFDRGRQLAAEGRRMLLELGQSVQYAALAMPVSLIELLADDAQAAERLLREAHEILTAAGERGYLSTISPLLGLALAKQNRYEEAGALADEGRQLGAADDVTTQIYWRVAKAHAVAASGDTAEAARLAAETVEIAWDETTFDSAIVLVEVANYVPPDDARAALQRALEDAIAKGNVVMEARARERLAALP